VLYGERLRRVWGRKHVWAKAEFPNTFFASVVYVAGEA